MANANDAAAGVKYNPSPAEAQSLLGSPGGIGYKPLGFGSEITRARKLCYKGIYNFAVQGGKVGNINLCDARHPSAKLTATGFVPLILPTNFIVARVLIDVITAPTSGGSATIAVSTGVTAADILAATAKASFTGLIDGSPVNTAATSIKVGQKLNGSQGVIPYIAVAVAALTAGLFNVHIEGYMGD